MTAALLAGIFATSLLGSVHCLAMCGPLVGLHGGAKTVRLAFVHSLGRATTYVVLGALAGLVGSAVNLAGDLANMQRTATIVAAALVIGLGVYQIVDVHVTRARARGRARPRSSFSAALVHIRPKSAVKRSYLIGTLTGLLPCGWLWAFVIAAAGTGSVLAGAATMLAFWLGTVPAMTGLLAFAGPIVSRIRARLPVITAVALVALGLGTLALRWHDAGATQVEAPSCHDPGAS